MAAGAASLSDSSIRSRPSSSSSSSSTPRREVALLVPGFLLLLAVATGGPGGSLDAGHQMAQDLLGDEERALQLEDGLTRGVEEDDVIRALAVPVDRVREAAAAPGRDLHDLAA